MSVEQEARDLLERLGHLGAQTLSSGDLVELANIINNARFAEGMCNYRENLQVCILTLGHVERSKTPHMNAEGTPIGPQPEPPLLMCSECKNTESCAGAMARMFNHGRCMHCGGYFKVVRA